MAKKTASKAVEQAPIKANEEVPVASEQNEQVENTNEQQNGETGGDETLDVGEVRPVIDPLTLPTLFSQKDADAIRQGIIDGHIFTTPKAVTIRKKSNPALKKDEVQPYIAYFAADLAGALILSGNKEQPALDAPEKGQKDERTEEDKRTGACDHFNYGFGLSLYQNPIRNILDDAIAGPEKAIANSVKHAMAGKMFDTEDEAREWVIARRVKQGLPV
jgi:hypothetical protein